MTTNLNCSVFDSLLDSNSYEITILSNASSFINSLFSDINWCGFYLLKDNQLILGPFQGLTACTTISLDKGVCGFCATSKQTVIVDNVHEFKGHIACDSRSNSEICVPIFVSGVFYGLLDIDSPLFNRFSQEDKQLLESLVKVLEKHLNNCKKSEANQK